jgi:hypothetical protein
MIQVNGSTSAPRETDIRIAALIEEELESVKYRKERLDLYHPKHAREMSSDQLCEIARARVIIRLCAPWCDARVPGCGEDSEYF